VRLRFSLLRLMTLVLIIAIGLAAAMAGAFTFAVVVLSAATLCALLRHGPSRAFFLGCAVFGWASMLLAFGAGPEIRYCLPTIRPIVLVYEAVHGPTPASFKTKEEAQQWITQMVDEVNGAITVGHSLIAMVLALAGGIVLWLIANWRMRGARRGEPGPLAGGPIA
jgi:hypothetical protein